VGARCWELLPEHEDLHGLTTALEHEFDVDPQTLRGDVKRLLEQLRAAGLVAEEPAR